MYIKYIIHTYLTISNLYIIPTLPKSSSPCHSLFLNQFNKLYASSLFHQSNLAHSLLQLISIYRVWTKQHKTHFWGSSKCRLGYRHLFSVVNRCLLQFVYSVCLQLVSPLSPSLSHSRSLSSYCLQCFYIFLLFLLFTLRRINESGLLMCSRISSLDYTCNLHPVSSGLVYASPIPLFPAVVAFLGYFS